MPTPADMKRKTIYVLADEDRTTRYLGSTDLTPRDNLGKAAHDA
jgi:hypothetical protein